MIGIYKITSPSKKIYIGQSINIERRFRDYKKTRCVGQSRIFNSLKKYGANKHKFEVLCECRQSELNTMERYYQDLLSSIGEQGLNLILTKTDNLSGQRSEETKQKIKNSSTGRICTEEHKKNISLGVKKRPPISDATRKKIGDAARGRVFSAEHRYKLGSNTRGKKFCKITRTYIKNHNII